MNDCSETPMVLVAMPRLRDPNFQKTVVLVMEHNADGAMGFILNRPAETDVRDLVVSSDLEIPPNIQAWFGGPVGDDNGLILYKPDEENTWGDIIEISSSEETLLKLIGHHKSPKDYNQYMYPYRFVIGHSAWEGGQLDDEIRSGIWLPGQMNKNLLLDCPWQEMWPRCLDQIGVNSANLVTYEQTYMN